MRVLSPVGTFPVRITGARVDRNGPFVEAAMGSWRSEVRLEPADLPLLLGAGALLTTAFIAGRVMPGRARAR
jgi:hypothetical protein